MNYSTEALEERRKLLRVQEVIPPFTLCATVCVCVCVAELLSTYIKTSTFLQETITCVCVSARTPSESGRTALVYVYVRT